MDDAWWNRRVLVTQSRLAELRVTAEEFCAEAREQLRSTALTRAALRELRKASATWHADVAAAHPSSNATLSSTFET